MSLLQEQKIQSPDEIIQQVLDEGHRSLYTLCSGGKDSITTTHFTKENFPNQYKGTVYTMTGVGLKQTRWFVRDYCKEMGWNLIFAWTPFNYKDTVLMEGFPSPFSHNVTMFQLKFITWRLFEREHRNEDMIFVGGIRKRESKRRSKRYQSPFQHDGKTHFCSPLFYKTGNDIWDYHAKHGLKLTPAHKIYDFSMDCAGGCFGNTMELQLMKKYNPEFFGFIQWLEKLVEQKLDELIKELHATSSQVANWCRMRENKLLSKFLEPKQRQLANLKLFGKWGHGKDTQGTTNIINQTLLDEFGNFEQTNLGNHLCSESCAVGDYQ